MVYRFTESFKEVHEIYDRLKFKPGESEICQDIHLYFHLLWNLILFFLCLNMNLKPQQILLRGGAVSTCLFIFGGSAQSEDTEWIYGLFAFISTPILLLFLKVFSAQVALLRSNVALSPIQRGPTGCFICHFLRILMTPG